MGLLSEEEKYKIKERRGFKSAKTGVKHPPSKLVIHHPNRNPKNNAPKNVVVLTIQEHKDLHERAKK